MAQWLLPFRVMRREGYYIIQHQNLKPTVNANPYYYYLLRRLMVRKLLTPAGELMLLILLSH